jgi:LemA protein
MTVWVIVCVVIALAAFIAVTFNELIASRNRVRTAWADIDVQLQRRHDLIPQLAAVVKGYADHESQTLTAVTELRAKAQQETSVTEKSQIESQIGAGLSKLIAVQENYPDLKANENFLALQRELVDTEDKLQTARNTYNETFRAYNTQIQNFPDVTIAEPFGFDQIDYFQATDKAPVKL